MTQPPRKSDGTSRPQKSSSPPRNKPGQMISPDALRLEAEKTPGLPARLAAAAIVSEVLGSGNALDERFASDDSHAKLSALDPRDRGLARSIAIVSLRRLGTIRYCMAALLERGLPKQVGQLEWILVTGAAQILFLDVPDHAAVDLAVRAVRLDPKTAAFAGMVNGVLRNLIRRRDEFLAGSDPLDHDTPQWLAARWRKTYGEDVARAIASANVQEPTLDLSVKSDAEGWAQRLDGDVLPTGSVRLRGHVPIAELEGYHDGEWWVQDVAASLPAKLLAVQPGERVADICAAPGGKTAQLAAAGADVTAIDRSAERLKRLKSNLSRLELEADVVVADAASYSAASFDAVLVDAPCTATGTIRRHPDVAWTKKTGDIGTLAKVQERILDRAIALTKPGGRVVYCTCSLEPEEGEQQIAALLRRNPDVSRSPILASEVGGMVEIINENGEVRTLPSYLQRGDARQSGMDGFFAARLIRNI